MSKSIEIEIRNNRKQTYLQHLSNEQYELLLQIIRQRYIDAICYIDSKGYLTESIKKIVITDNYRNDVIEQGKLWGFETTTAHYKEYAGASKILFNNDYSNPVYYIFVDFDCLPGNEHWTAIIYSQLSYPYYENQIPIEIRYYSDKVKPCKKFSDYICKAVSAWSNCISAHKFIVNNDLVSYCLTSKQLINYFTRQLKHSLFDYNSDGDKQEQLDRFWDVAFTLFSNFILRAIGTRMIAGNIELENDNITNSVNRIIDEAQNLQSLFEQNCKYDLQEIQNEVIDFFNLYGIEISETELSVGFRIHLAQNPKDYFREFLVDTEPRIICFLDILGFKEMIKEYEFVPESTILQDIQDAFKEAIGIVANQKDKDEHDILKHLEYKTFSDNICISIPFFDNELDFLANLNLIISFTRGLQSILMAKGFFTRGGLSYGSYYSDANIIFSYGMVEAYEIESSIAVNPRIVLSTKLCEKLKGYNSTSLDYYNIGGSLIQEGEVVFLNPFELLGGTNRIMKNVENTLLQSLKDNELLSPLTSMVNELISMTFDVVNSKVDEENDMMEKIKDRVEQLLLENQNIERVFNKYLWLKNFIKWIETKDANLGFNYWVTSSL